MKETSNVFEKAAETMKADEDKAFMGLTASEKFYKLVKSSDTKVIGRRYPQTDYINTAIAHLISYHEFPPFPLRFDKIELYKSAKLTDCISTAAISSNAFILSKRALEIFHEFDLGNYKIYPATVYHKEIAYEYGVLHFLNDLQDSLNFEESSFYVANLLTGFEFDIEISDKADFEGKRQQVKNGEYPGTKQWWYVKLKRGKFLGTAKTPDIFTLLCGGVAPYISKNLAQAIIENKLSGFEIENVFDLED